MPELNVASSANLINELEVLKKQLEIEKLRAETAKIEIERKELNKRWFQKPQWWSVLVPFIIGAGTILIAFLTGFISIERLKNEKAELAKTIDLQKDSIIYFSKSLQEQRDSLVERVSLEQENIKRLQKLKGSLQTANSNQGKIILLNNREKLDRINQEIYMYEDHDSFYQKFDKAVDDTTSKYDREKKLEELRRVRKEILSQLKLSPKS